MTDLDVLELSRGVLDAIQNELQMTVAEILPESPEWIQNFMFDLDNHIARANKRKAEIRREVERIIVGQPSPDVCGQLWLNTDMDAYLTGLPPVDYPGRYEGDVTPDDLAQIQAELQETKCSDLVRWIQNIQENPTRSLEITGGNREIIYDPKPR